MAPLNQQTLYIGMFALGLLFQFGVCRQRNVWFAACFAFPSGLALALVVESIMVVTPIDFRLVNLLALGAPMFGAFAYLSARCRPTRRELLTALGATVAFGLVVVAICSIDGSTFSRDSKSLLAAARYLSENRPYGEEYFRMKGALAPLAYSLGFIVSDDYMYGFAPVSAASFVLVYIAAGWVYVRGQSARRNSAVVALALAAGATFTTYMMLFHSFYVHTNLHAAMFLFAFVTSVYALTDQSKTGLATSACLMLVGYALTRVEGTMFALVVLVLAVPRIAAVSTRAARLVAAGWGGSMLLWLGYLMTLPQHAKLTDQRVHVLFATVGGVGLALAFYTRIRPMRWLVERARFLVPVSLVLAMVVACALQWSNMEVTFDVMWRNLFYEKRMWGFDWYVLLILLPFVLALSHKHAESLFTEVAVSIVLCIFVLASVHPYRFGIGDSGNRMLLQVMPVLVFAAAIAAHRLWGDARAQAEEDTAT